MQRYKEGQDKNKIAENNAISSRRLSKTEATQIEVQIKGDLVDHLYKSTMPGVVTGFLSSIAVFIYLYSTTANNYLVLWIVGFNLFLVKIIFIDFLYKKNKNRFSLRKWLYLYCVFISFCSIFWGSIALFMPEYDVAKYILIATISMIAASYSNGTVGVFSLCVVSLGFIMFPVSIWLILQGTFYTKMTALFLFLYYLYLIGMNFRSSMWLKDSLRLKIENTFFTHQANHDILTGLPNQRSLINYLSSNIESIANQGYKTYGIAVISLSVNRLDMFHTSLGYVAGDSIIQELAKRLQGALNLIIDRNKFRGKLKVMLARSRHDAFTIILEPTNVIDLDHEVFELCKVVKPAFQLENREAIISAGVGVACYPQDGVTAAILLSNSQASMLNAKKSGGDKVVFYEKKINAKTPWELTLENDLYHALKNRELSNYYQPLIEAKTGRVYGFEALVRWIHPKHGLINPGDFIHVAENTGLIIPMGEYILEECCSDIKDWINKGFGILELKYSVNVSVKQLQALGFIDMVKKVVNSTGVDPKCLDFELIENDIVDESLLPVIQEIKDLGITVSIDDFGTGYSGFGYLRKFSVEKIKIDKSFIDDVLTNPESATIVSAILAMSKELGIKTVAEGVEKKEQLEYLQQKKCNYIQGYYFSRPSPKNEITNLLYKELKKFSGPQSLISNSSDKQ